jgi:hypothetical protein
MLAETRSRNLAEALTGSAGPVDADLSHRGSLANAVRGMHEHRKALAPAGPFQLMIMIASRAHGERQR